MFQQMVLLFHSHVFLRVPPVHGVVAHSVFLRVPPVHAGSERIYRSFASSHRLPWCSLAGGVQYFVPSRATCSVQDQIHSRAHRSTHLSMQYSFLLPRAWATASVSQAVVTRRWYLL